MGDATVSDQPEEKNRGSPQWTSTSSRENYNSRSETGTALMAYAQMQSLPLQNLVSNLQLIGRLVAFHHPALRHSSFKQKVFRK